MTFRLELRNWVNALLGRDQAAQIVEFAVSLPLLLIFVVGIFDFSGAFTLKQKLTDVARDAARGAAADPVNDLLSHPSTTEPVSVRDALQIVGKYLTANNLNGCGIVTAAPTRTSPATWTYSAGSPCTGTSITVNRAYYFSSGSTVAASANCSETGQGVGPTTVLATCVNIQYAYPWRFNRVVTLLGASSLLPSAISATAVALNEN